MDRLFAFSAALLLLICNFACGGSGCADCNRIQPAIIISPHSASLLTNQSSQFTAAVTGLSNAAVNWSVQEQAGGTINAGLYKAPGLNGTYHVVTTSAADASLRATATVSVAAPFAYIQQNASGQAAPWSVTPVIGKFAGDNSFALASLNQDVAMFSVVQSPDASKIAYDLITVSYDWLGFQYTTCNIYVANVDGTGVTQLTVHQPGDSVLAWWPAFSVDGTQLYFVEEDNTNYPAYTETIWATNLDGSNQHAVFGDTINLAFKPAFSPDGTKLVAEVLDESTLYDGVVTMNIDGSSLVRLTGQTPDPNCPNGYFDEFPTYTNDGQHISFSRVCNPVNGVGYESLYIMNTDGTGLTKLHGDNATFTSAEPVAVVDRLVFTTNVDMPGTTQFELYSIKPDGTGLTRLTNNTVYDGPSYWPYISNSSISAHALSAQAQVRSKPHSSTGPAHALRERLRNR